MSYTPKMQLNFNLFNGYGLIGNGADIGDGDLSLIANTACGIQYWKGMNDRGPMIEFTGEIGGTTSGASALPGVESPVIRQSAEFMVRCVVPPFVGSSTYTNYLQLDEEVQQSSGTGHEVGWMPSNHVAP